MQCQSAVIAIGLLDFARPTFDPVGPRRIDGAPVQVDELIEVVRSHSKLGFPNPIGAAFGLLMSALLIKVVRLDMERFSKGLLVGIVIAGVFFVYLIFLLIFSFLFNLLEPVLQPLVGRSFKH